MLSSVKNNLRNVLMKKSVNVFGISYFLIHCLIETTTFYIITNYSDSDVFWYLALIYDYFSFVPQGFFGFLKDKGIKINFAVTGTFISAAALVLFRIKSSFAFPVIILLAVGNGLIHVQGAECTLRSSAGKMTPSALFVSGGSFGIIIGKILAMREVPFPIIMTTHLFMLIPILFCAGKKDQLNKKNLLKYNFSNQKVPSKIIIILAVTVVIARAFMGYGIPTTWNRSLFQTVLLYCAMGVGKALGGILTDALGGRKCAALSTLGALPFLLFGDRIMEISLIGIMLFSMTMAITLGLLVSELKKYPGVAFGLTTLGLFIGSMPVFVLKIESLAVNCIIVSSLSAACFLILNAIC